MSPRTRSCSALRALALPLLLLFPLAAAAPPHIVLIVADDLGFGDVGYTGLSNIRTPNIDALQRKGARLSRYYGQPVCSPSRAALHTGRYPLVYGLQTYVIDPVGVDYGLNLNETTLPELLRDRGGYQTHAVGKWHLGSAQWAQTPTFRGYNSFHGFYLGGQDYFTHMASGGYDLNIDVGANCGANCSRVDWASAGRYSTELYASTAVDVISAHDPATPLFLYVAFQAVHSPDEVPEHYIDPYNATIADKKRRVFAGMLSCLDEGVGNITTALARAGMADNTLVVFVADNGAPIECSQNTCGDANGGTNYPLRGGKHSLWEGGVRLTAVASGPMLNLPPGSNFTGLMHHTDWLPTLLEAAGVEYTPSPGFELHGVSQWGALTRGAQGTVRNETLLNSDPVQPAVDNSQLPGAGNAAIVTAEGWKLHLGLTGPPWAWSAPNSSTVLPGGWGDAAPAPAPPSVDCALAPVPNLCYPGNDLVPGGVPAKAASACCAACAALNACVSWTWRASTALCFLKAGQEDGTADSDCTSSPLYPPVRLWPLHNMTAQLFNLTVDPWERDDVAAAHPDVVAQLTARLAQWGVRAAQPYWWGAKVDPKSAPSKRNGTWVPWL